MEIFIGPSRWALKNNSEVWNTYRRRRLAVPSIILSSTLQASHNLRFWPSALQKLGAEVPAEILPMWEGDHPGAGTNLLIRENMEGSLRKYITLQGVESLVLVAVEGVRVLLWLLCYLLLLMNPTEFAAFAKNSKVQSSESKWLQKKVYESVYSLLRH